MQLLTLTALLPLLPFALSKSIPITVGKGGLVFNPETVTAAAGDTLEFSFYPQSHSVAPKQLRNALHRERDRRLERFFPCHGPEWREHDLHGYGQWHRAAVAVLLPSEALSVGDGYGG